jgi:GTP-binding protein Era
VPQTTRNNIRGIVTTEQGQIVFMDTPGIHKSEKKLNLHLKAETLRAVEGADLFIYMLDASRFPSGAEEEEAAQIISSLGGDAILNKTIALINKIDNPNAQIDECETFLQEKIPSLSKDRIFQISALKKEGLDAALDCLFNLSPEGHAYYDAEFYTDQEVHFRITEIIREKCFLFLREELPHCINVKIEELTLKDNTLNAHAIIYTERENQKGIVIGQGASMIKKIRLAALHDIQNLFDWKINLKLDVKVVK